MRNYLEILEVLKKLLQDSGNNHWAAWIEKDIEEWNQSKSTGHHLSAYGGMGSINDLFVGGNDSRGIWEDSLFVHCKSFAYNLAKRNGKGGSELVDTKPYNLLTVIQGWICLDCGYAQTTYSDIESIVANKWIPLLLKEKLEVGNIPSILPVDGLIVDSRVENLRGRVIQAIKSSDIILVDKIDGWMRPCPNCGSKDTAVYRWNLDFTDEKIKISPAANNIKLKKSRHNNTSKAMAVLDINNTDSSKLNFWNRLKGLWS